MTYIDYIFLNILVLAIILLPLLFIGPTFKRHKYVFAYFVILSIAINAVYIKASSLAIQSTLLDNINIYATSFLCSSIFYITTTCLKSRDKLFVDATIFSKKISSMMTSALYFSRVEYSIDNTTVEYYQTSISRLHESAQMYAPTKEVLHAYNAFICDNINNIAHIKTPTELEEKIYELYHACSSLCEYLLAWNDKIATHIVNTIEEDLKHRRPT